MPNAYRHNFGMRCSLRSCDSLLPIPHDILPMTSPTYCRCPLPHTEEDFEAQRKAKNDQFKADFEKFFREENPDCNSIIWLDGDE